MSEPKTAGGTFRKVLASETGLFRDHLLRLDSDGRRMRFIQAVPDDYVEAYALKAHEVGSVIYGYFSDAQIRAAGELKRSGPFWGARAEGAFSVEPDFENLGIASELMRLLIRSARNRGVTHLELNCLAENAKMRAIAGKYTSELHLEHGDAVADIVPRWPDYLSVATEAMDDRFAFFYAALDQQTRLARLAA